MVETLESAVGSAGSGMGVPPLLVVADTFWDLFWGDLVAVGALFEPVTVEVMEAVEAKYPGDCLVTGGDVPRTSGLSDKMCAFLGVST